MELVEKSAKDRFEDANKEISKHCFEVGRLRFVIELDEEALEKKKLEYRNRRMDFDKLNKELQRAAQAWQEEEKANQQKDAPLPETLN